MHKNAAIPTPLDEGIARSPGLTFSEDLVATQKFEENTPNSTGNSGSSFNINAAIRGPAMSHVDEQGRADMVDTSDVRLCW